MLLFQTSVFITKKETKPPEQKKLEDAVFKIEMKIKLTKDKISYYEFEKQEVVKKDTFSPKDKMRIKALNKGIKLASAELADYKYSLTVAQDIIKIIKEEPSYTISKHYERLSELLVMIAEEIKIAKESGKDAGGYIAEFNKVKREMTAIEMIMKLMK